MMSQKTTVALIQSSAPWFDLTGSIDRLSLLTEQAAAQGAEIVMFPEAFIGGYPRGLGFGTVVGDRTEAGREMWLRYAKACPVEDGPEIERIKKVAADNRVCIAVGVVERCRIGGSLYCSILYFSSTGQLVGRHRKLKPTAAERIIWADSNIEDSLCVIDSPFGKMGGLICWENYMPLARKALYEAGVELYFAPTADQRDRWHHSMVHIALESRAFVVSVNQFVSRDSLGAALLNEYPELESLPEPICRGGSMVVDPMGNMLVAPVWDKEEIILQELDSDLILKAKMDFDTVGHYSRSDAFEFSVLKRDRPGP